MKKEKISFEQYFESIYQQRWIELKKSLLNTNAQVIRPCFDASEMGGEKYPTYNHSLYEKIQQLSPRGLKQYYVMDLASIICATSLEVQADDFVLDMCAAPGGKALILAEKLKTGTLWVNELSANRRSRLKQVIQDYIPPRLRENIFIKGKDGNRYGLMYPNYFDKILLDAPCSGEKHLLENPHELEKWTIKRTQRLAKNQYSLLCSAILALKSGGQLVYSTCSISPLENDEVIKKALTKKSDQVVLDLPEIDFPGIEKTEVGYIMLPDQAQAGPIYFSRLLKK